MGIKKHIILGLSAIIVLGSWNMVSWAKDTIKVGISCAKSGPAKGLGERYLMGWLACFKQENKKGGINGKEIQWVVLDDAYNGANAVKNTQTLLNKGVDLLAGYVGTPTTRAVIDWMEKNNIKIPFFFPLTGAKIIKKTVFSDVYAIRPFYSDEIALMVDFFVSRGYSKFGIFYQDDTFGLTGRDGFLRAVNKYDLLPCYEGKYNKKTLEMEKTVKLAIEEKPEVIILVGTAPPAAKFINSVLEEGKGYNPVFVCLSFILPEELVELVNDNKGELKIYVSQVVPCPCQAGLSIVEEYKKAIREFYPTEKFSFTSLEGYISARLLCNILKGAKSFDPEGIKRAVESLQACDIGLGINFCFSPLIHRSKLFAGLYKWSGSGWQIVAQRRFGFTVPTKGVGMLKKKTAEIKKKNIAPIAERKKEIKDKKTVDVVLASVEPEK